jgi:hypothetical protein
LVGERRLRMSRAAVAVTLVFALLLAPMRVAFQPGCDLCPPDCPMHHAPAGQPKCHGEHGAAALHCHNALGMHQRASGDRSPHLTRPPCGNHGAVEGLTLTPMILPGAVAWRVAPRVGSSHLAPAQLAVRAADPPDTPPPIHTA